MTLLNPYEWRLLSERPGKRIFAKVDPSNYDLIIKEEWTEDATLLQAQQERELAEGMAPGANLKPLVVIPPSVQNRAINEGWANDRKAWKRWANDIDNRSLRITDGRV